MESIEKATTSALVSLVDGIVTIASTGAPSTAETVTETLGAVLDITRGTRRPILFDARQWPSGEPASWVRFISTIETVCVAGAVLIGHEAASRLGDFPNLLDRLVIPFQVFADEPSAVAFLATFVDDQSTSLHETAPAVAPL